MAPLCLAKASDVTVFRDPSQQELFQKAFRQIQKEKADPDFFSPENSRDAMHCITSYDSVSRQTLYPLAFTQYIDKHPTATTLETTIALNKTFMEMSAALLRTHFSSWFLLYIQNIKNGARDLPLLAAICLVACVGFLRRPHGFPLLAFVILLLYSTNIFSIAVVEQTLYRYTFYTEISVQILLVLCIAKVLGCGRVHHTTAKSHV